MNSAEISLSSPPPSLAFSMRMFAEESNVPATAAGFRAIASVLENGGSWADAVAAAGRRLPTLLRGVFVIAERSGSVEQAVGDYLAGSRRARRTQRVVFGALLYPALLLIVTGLILLGIFTLIVPPFQPIFEDFGITMPLTTLVLIRTSQVVAVAWPWILGVLLIGGLLLLVAFYTLRLPMSASAVRMLQAIPVLGTASQLAGASDFCLLLSLLVRAQIPLPEALRLVAGGLRDANLRQGSLRLATEIERGESAAYAASVLPNFPPRLVSLMRHAHHERLFSEILRSHGELFALQAESHAGISVMWMQPFMLLAVAIVSATVVFSMFLPLINMMNALS